MFDAIGLGLVLNILLWLGALVIACCLGVFAIMGFIPGDKAKKPRHGTHRGRRSPTSTGVSPG